MKQGACTPCAMHAHLWLALRFGNPSAGIFGWKVSVSAICKEAHQMQDDGIWLSFMCTTTYSYAYFFLTTRL